MTNPAPVPVVTSPTDGGWSAPRLFPFMYGEFGRMLEGFSKTWGAWPGPAAGDGVRMDCAETKDGIELTAELPGLKDKDIQVVVSDGALTISGEKRAEHERKDGGYTLFERSYGAFSRSVALPADIDRDKIRATMADGVLKVVAPRLAKSAPQKIEVQASA